MSYNGVRVARKQLASDDVLPHGHSSDIGLRAWRAAKEWIAAEDLDQLLSSSDLCFSQGDSNLSNYLWTDGGCLVLIDWEYSGLSDPVLELAGLAEHASTRALAEDFWMELADAIELGPANCSRLARARKAMACFWIVLIANRQRQGLPTTLTADEQAHRTLTILQN